MQAILDGIEDHNEVISVTAQGRLSTDNTSKWHCVLCEIFVKYQVILKARTAEVLFLESLYLGFQAMDLKCVILIHFFTFGHYATKVEPLEASDFLCISIRLEYLYVVLSKQFLWYK